jgi:hypothetical protein
MGKRNENQGMDLRQGLFVSPRCLDRHLFWGVGGGKRPGLSDNFIFMIHHCNDPSHSIYIGNVSQLFQGGLHFSRHSRTDIHLRRESGKGICSGVGILTSEWLNRSEYATGETFVS